MGFTVDLHIKDWRIKKNSEGMPCICGEYSLKSGEVELASKSFGDGYGSLQIPFSGELMKKVSDLEKCIKEEMHVLIG